MKAHALFFFIAFGSLHPGKAAGETPILTYLLPVQEIKLASAESGIVTSILVKPGDRVAKGQEILRLNMTVIEAQLAQAEAKARHEGRMKSAEAECRIARQRLDIIEDLRNRGSTNEAEQDKAAASLAVAEGQLKAVEEERESQLLEAAMIKAQLDQRILRSPIDGVVTEVTRSVGESVEARRTEVPDYLIKVVDLTELIARVHIPAAIAAGLQLKQELRIVLDDKEKTEGKGSITFISPTVDAATGLTEVHLSFENTDGKLRSGIAGNLIVPQAGPAG